MNTKLAEQVEQAQGELHDAILKALNEFSEKTGLVATKSRWEYTIALNKSGNTCAVGYFGVTTTITTG